MNASALRTEEDVKIKFLLPYLKRHGYLEDCIRFNVAIDVQEGRKKKTIFADAVVYASPRSSASLLLCETKAPFETLDRKVREQAISYARLLPVIAPLVLITNGSQVQIYQTVTKNRVPELLHRKQLKDDIVDYVISRDLQDALRADAKHELFIIDDVQTFKRILRSCHCEIRNNEGYDPATAFDEMSKVLFCKMYEEKTNPRNNRFRVSIFDDTLQRLGVNVVRQVFKETTQDPNYSILFTDNVSISLHDRTIRKIVDLFEGYDLSLTAFDVQGEAFEYFLGDTFTGGLGEYFTPRNVVEFMVDAINPKIGETIIDPFCGTGGFLIYAFEVISERIRLQEFSEEEKAKRRLELSNRCLFGTDWKERTTQACKMNMMVHGDGSAGIFLHHGLTDVEGRIEAGRFNVCLTNPPFGSTENDPNVLKQYELGAGRKSQDRVILAIERAVCLVKPGGRIGIVVIDGILDTARCGYVRDYIRSNTYINAVISLARETFQGYGSRASTSILFLKRKEKPDDVGQGPVFMAIAHNTGYAPNGAPTPGNELPDILMDYQEFMKGSREFRHPESWVVERADDRLDAHFYSTLPGRQERDMQGAVDRVSELMEKSAREIDALQKDLGSAFQNVEFKTVKMSEVLAEVQEKEKVNPEYVYRFLGIHSWGKGAFVREEKRGSEIKSKTVFRVSKGWVIYNRLFAWRGSFALLEEEHDQCYVSSEFPTFVVRAGIPSPELVSKYIVFYMTNPHCLGKIRSKSTGSTKGSRNRFNQKLFLAMTVDMPKATAKFRLIVELLERSFALWARQEQLVERMRILKEGISSLLPFSDGALDFTSSNN